MKTFGHGHEPTVKVLIEQDMAFDPDATTPFDYYHPDPAVARITPSVEAFQAIDELGDAMIDQPPVDTTGDSSIPPIYTYWGQFIDHELTARTDLDTSLSVIFGDPASLTAADPGDVISVLTNRRTPNFELDGIYGSLTSPADADRDRYQRNYATALRQPNSALMRTGMNTDIGFTTPPLNGVSLARDLPRLHQIDPAVLSTLDDPDLTNANPELALIGDPRNDENLIVSQFHTALLHFHNAVVQWLQANDSVAGETPDQLFERARKIVQWTFQWLVVNDYLKTICIPQIVELVLAEEAPFYTAKFQQLNKLFMPLEFSVSAFRFGHSMIRGTYDYNRNFGRGAQFLDQATLVQLFEFTGGGGFPLPAGAQSLPSNWIIEWDRFTDFNAPVNGDGLPERFARRIDTHLAEPLGDLLKEGNDLQNGFDFKTLSKQLARRNLRRSLILSLPTGQALAQTFGLTPLTTGELRMGLDLRMQSALERGKFLENTPLWFYLLREAEIIGGNSLGMLGSRVVAETMIGSLINDNNSYLSQDNTWHPGKPVPGATSKPVFSSGPMMRVSDLLAFTGVR